QQQGNRHKIHDYSRAAIAHQWQGQSLGGQQPQCYTNVNKSLYAKPQHNPLRHQATENSLHRYRLTSYLKSTPNHKSKQGEHGKQPNETELLANNSNNKISMRLGKVMQFFNTGP